MIFNSNILILRVEILILKMLKLGGNMKHKILLPIKGTSHSNDFNNKQKFAFTLAEVLITLGVIGVVAAVTMPTVVANYQKQAAAMKAKKFYNMMNNAVNRSIVDNGDVNTWFPERKNNTYNRIDSMYVPRNILYYPIFYQ